MMVKIFGLRFGRVGDGSVEKKPEQDSGGRGSLFGLSLRKRPDKLASSSGKSVAKKKGEIVPEPTKDSQPPKDMAQPGPASSVSALLRTAIADAEQIAASIKMRAQNEAEAEAARIVARAKLEAEEVKGQAGIVAQGEAEKILSEANKKAEIVEMEARQRALQFLVKASEEIGKEIQGDYTKAYSQLSSSLRDIMAEAQKIGAELEGKATKLLETKGFKIEGYEAALL
ncbi:hypothetical protein ACFLYX_02150, partial [Chloroflexota bacterium]